MKLFSGIGCLKASALNSITSYIVVGNGGLLLGIVVIQILTSEKSQQSHFHLPSTDICEQRSTPLPLVATNCLFEADSIDMDIHKRCPLSLVKAIPLEMDIFPLTQHLFSVPPWTTQSKGWLNDV
jgi:hypothetical protein